MSRKITLIGAGSVVFAKTLMGDILQRAALADSHICLMDIDAQRLKVAEQMMKKMAQKLGVPAQITATMDQREAVRGAKYVICTVQVGGYKPSTVRDFEIPAKYGLKQTIADTLGIGGIFRALRTIPVVNSIARDIAQVGHPDCLLLNYTNPMAMNCWAVEKAVGIPCVGLCHSVFGTARLMAGHIGIPFEEINYLVAGVNHMAFFLKFEYHGQDAYPLLFKVLESPERNYELVRYEMMRRTGYFSTESSEHLSEYLPYFIHHGAETIRRFGIPLNEYIRRCETMNESWHMTQANLLGPDRDIEILKPSFEYGAYIIHAKETNISQTVYGNVTNRGLIENLPDDCCVEVPCLVDGNGVQPARIGRLPDHLAALCQTNINPQRLTVDAALTGRREAIYHAAMLDPHTAASLTLDQIWAMCDELIEAHQKDGYLGQFAPVIKNTGRAYAGLGDRAIARLYAESGDLSVGGGEIRLRLEVENPAPHGRSFVFAIAADETLLEIPSPYRRISLDVPAGETIARTIRLRLQKATDQNIPVRLSCEQDNVLVVGRVLLPRAKIEADAQGRAHFAYAMAGFPAVEGYFQREDTRLTLTVKVNDSNIHVNRAGPYAGSSVCLLFAQGDDSPIFRCCLIPEGQEGMGCAVTMEGKPMSGIAVSLRKTKSDYTLEAHMDASMLGLKRADRFIFDAITRINALGDAHSGGRCSLSGDFGGYETTAHYAQVCL